MFAPYLQRWCLTPDGPPRLTHNSALLPVRWQGQAAMLKLAHEAEEQRGHAQMVWWRGQGAAPVHRHEGPALLLRRAPDASGLVPLAQSGLLGDAQASGVLCQVAARLHAPRSWPSPELLPLEVWFRSLREAALLGGLFREAAELASALLASPREVVGLHGDLHHANILRFAEQEWLAIDPKGLLGERTFEFAPSFFNPDAAHSGVAVALRPGRLRRQAQLISRLAHVNAPRLLGWVAAYGGLSAAWHLEDGEPQDAHLALAVARLALQELARV